MSFYDLELYNCLVVCNVIVIFGSVPFLNQSPPGLDHFDLCPFLGLDVFEITCSISNAPSILGLDVSELTSVSVSS